MTQHSKRKLTLLSFGGVLAVMLLLSAWIADDAMITLRQVEMFVAGEGIVWNIGQRVQSFTHPLWFLGLSAVHSILPSSFWAALLLSFTCTGLAYGLYLTYCAQRTSLALPLVFMGALPLASEGITDFMASGLENPLSLLLVACLFALIGKNGQINRRSLLWIVLAASVLTRPDHAFLFGPVALWQLAQLRRIADVRPILPGAAFLALWYGFSVFYFGSPFPNTYYAKLYTGLERDLIFGSGLLYLEESLYRTPITCFLILLAPVCMLRATAFERAIGLGIVVHLVYLASAGGDFMQGRLLSTSAFAGCYLLANAFSQRQVALPVAGVAVLLVGVRLASLAAVPGPVAPGWITDERRYYIKQYSPFAAERSWPKRPAQHAREDIGTHTYFVCAFVGAMRLKTPDMIHIVDQCGLTDPFLARMPMLELPHRPRPGHYVRVIPPNYAEALEAGRAEGFPPGSAVLFERMQLITKAPLWDSARLQAIWDLNTTAAPAPDEAWATGDWGERGMRRARGWISQNPPSFMLDQNPANPYYKIPEK